MIDLAKLQAAAESTDGDRTVVSRAYLAQVHAELSACRALQSRSGQVFGLKPGESL